VREMAGEEKDGVGEREGREERGVICRFILYILLFYSIIIIIDYYCTLFLLQSLYFTGILFSVYSDYFIIITLIISLY
jgi:hypothetical protein